MTVDMILELDGVDCESKDKKINKEIDVLGCCNDTQHPGHSGTPVEAPVLKTSATAAPVAEQSANVLHENDPEETSGPTASISDQLRPGKLFASFGLERELGIGSTGAVWLAEDYSLKRHAEKVALKFLPDFIVRDKTAVEELKYEIHRRIALKHPNIQRVYNLVENKGRIAIQMEYLDGQSLSRLRLTKPNQIFEVRDLEKWVKELCEALEYAHKDVGFISGDIAPGNLIVDVAGNLRLKDLGIANWITDSMSRSMVIHDTSETLAYMSPQRAAGGEPAITDVLYSLGATLYELLTGKPPFYAGDIGAHVSGKVPPSMTERRAELGIEGEAIPKNWEETVAACLAKDPVQRPQSAIEVEKRLKSATGSIAKTRPGVGTPPTRKPWLAIVGIIFILSFVSAIAFFAFRCLTEAKSGKIVLNTISPKANVFLDGVPIKEPSPTPTLPASPSGFTGKESSLSVVTPLPEVSPTRSSEVSLTPSSEVSLTAFSEVNPTPSPQEIASSNERQSTEPSPTPLSQPDVDPAKEGVVKRINALPGFTAEKKANLIEKMHKVRSMERLTVIPFDIGQTALHRAATDELVKAFDTPEMRDKLSDPTIILVVAGYADTAGRADLNLRFSQERAENVSKILKEQARLRNAMQTIGMGGTELLDSKSPDQNRAVEVWAVLPL
jgi:serine/threonine protein kinase